MKRTYPIREWKAIERFRSHLSNDPGTIQMVLPLAEIAELLRQGVSQLLHETEKRLLLMIMDDEVAWLTTDTHGYRIESCDAGAASTVRFSFMVRSCRFVGRGFAAKVGR